MKSHKNNFRRRGFKLLLIIILIFIINIFIGIFVPPISATAPSAPILKTPTNNAFLNDTQPNLEWYPSYDPESAQLKYEIQVDEFNDDWTTLVINFTTGYSITSWEILSPLSDGTYQWRVRADDGKALPNSTSSWSLVWNFTIDTEAPSIVDGSGDFTAYTGKPFSIYANFTDNKSSVATSIIYYKLFGTSIYRPQIMLETAVNQFYITNQLLGINTTNDESDYEYHIIAQDQAGNKYKYSNSGGLDFIITVIDNTPPKIISGTDKISVTTDDEFSIFIECTDNIALSEATLFIRKIENEWENIILNKDLSRCRFIINYSELKSDLEFNTSDGINCEYYILVSDWLNNLQNYSNSSNVPWEIEVTDNDNPIALISSGNMVVTTDDPFTIYANFSDNIQATSAKIFIKETMAQDNNWFSLNMNEVSKNNFSITYQDLKTHPQLQMDTSTGNDYSYYVIASDLASNCCNYTQLSGKSWGITPIDNDPPILNDGSGNFLVTTDDPFVIHANFSDNIDVANAQIFIRMVDDSTNGDTQTDSKMDWKQITMMKNVTDDFGEFTITYDTLKSEVGLDTTNGGSLEYYIIASDSGGNQYNYSTVQNDCWEILILDNDPPVILNGSGNFSVVTYENFTINVDIYDNTEVKSATIFYKLIEPGEESQSISWSKYNLRVVTSPLNQDIIDNGLEISRFTTLQSELNLVTTSECLIQYYIISSDNSENIQSYGSSSNPYQITIVDGIHPIFESWSSEPKNLRADFDDDFIIKVGIIDVGGSGLDDQSIMIRYKRGSYDSIYHDYLSMAPVLSYGRTKLKSSLKTEWEFKIPKPEVDENNNINNRIRYGWELISGEYLYYEIQCKDMEGNRIESGVQTEYVDPVSINHFPVIKLIAPVGNENLSGKEIIHWVATDIDNDELLITIEIGTYNSESWSVLASNLSSNGTFVWDTTEFQNGNEYLIKIIASDSELIVEDVSEGILTIYNLDNHVISDDSSDKDVKSVISSRNKIIMVSTGISILAIISCSLFIGGTEIGKFKFLSLIFVPLYSKLHRDNVLDHFTRGQIYGYIKAKPGEHYNKIKAELELTNGTLSHHLRILEKEEFIYSQRDKYNARFYPKGYIIQNGDIAEMNKFQETVFNMVLAQPGISQQGLVQQLGTSQQVISYNLKKLVRDEKLRIIKQGRENTYYIQTPEISMTPYQAQTQPITYIQPQQVNIPNQGNISQSQYQDQQPSITPTDPQIQTTYQPRLPPGRPPQVNVNVSDSKKISESQE